VAFCPGEGSAAASLFVDAIQGAEKTIWLSSMVISSGPILGALNDHLSKGGVIRGVYDATQMLGVERDWQPIGKPKSPKLDLWLTIKQYLKGKHSDPYTPKGPHNFMHNKVLVTDRVVVTGSFNLSGNAESNAENVLVVKSADLVDGYKAYIEDLIKIYGAA
jgi:phosphatidylserine/phosphatidylglycerophosphate/cardiolipin synthase-like enzyme